MSAPVNPASANPAALLAGTLADKSAAGGFTPPPATPARRRARRRNFYSALLFLSPWIVGFLIFTLWPIVYSAYLSLTDYDVINAPTFTGLDNYVELVQDPKIALALGNTIFYTVLQVPLHIAVALALALLLYRIGQSSGFFRTVFFLPNMTPPVAVGVLFLLVFNGQNGFVNLVLGWFGVDGPAWTTDPNWVKPGLILMSLWQVGASVVILLAALQSVPKELYESARLDGAGFWRQTRSVTVPLISPALFFLVIINTIAGFNNFTEAYTAFFGSGNSTYSNDAALFYVIYLFQQGFEFLHMGYASAMAWLLFLIVLAVTVVQMVVSRWLVFYEGGSK